MKRWDGEMYLLSAQAQEMIEEAVNGLPDIERRQIWYGWANQHLRIFLPDGADRDDGPPMPAEVAVVALTALKAIEDAKRNLRASSSTTLSEDDLADLDNDITYIGAVTRLVQEAARSNPSLSPAGE